MTAPWIAAFAVLSVLVLLLAVLQLGLLRRIDAVLDRAESRLGRLPSEEDELGVSAGTRISPFEVVDGHGQVISSSTLLGHPALFLFLSPGCAPCRSLVEELNEDATFDPPTLIVAFLPDSPAGKALQMPSSLTVLYDRNGSVSQAFGSRALPQAFAVDGEGVVAAREVPGSVADLERLARLLTEGGDGSRDGMGEMWRSLSGKSVLGLEGSDVE
jgi:thiol-disulfide isomerase/thioredoxin